VDELDGILDGQDVVLPLEIRIVHHRSERRGFSGARRPGHEHEALLKHRKFFRHRRQAQLVRRENLARDEAEHRADAVLLVVEIRTVSREAGIFVAEVHIAGFLELLDLVFRCDLIDERLQIVAAERRRINAHHLAVDAEDRRVAGGEVQV